MNQSETIGELAKALCVVQAQLRPAKMDAENPFFKSKYATLESCWNACRDLLASNGLAIVQSPGSDGNGRIEVRSILMHTSGEWIASTVSLKPVKDDPQAAGSAISYGRRYGLISLVGLVSSEDEDDGNACSAPRETSPKVERTQPGPMPFPTDPITAEENRREKQKQAQRKADIEAKIKDVADTLGAEVVRGSEMANDQNAGGYTINQGYAPKHDDEPVVYFEGTFRRNQPSKSGKMQYIFSRAGGGKDVWVPESMLQKYGNGRVYITHWISEKFIQDEKLTADECVARCDDDELMESEWNPPPITDDDVPF
jgi:hypothetical protein